MSGVSQDLYEAMSTLRAVRRLRRDPIADDVLRRILQAAAWAPSGGNVQPWRVVVVKNREKRRAIGDLYQPLWQKYAAGHHEHLSKLSGEVLAKQKRMLAAADHLGDKLAEAPVLLVYCFNPANMAITDSNMDRPSIVGGASVYLAVQNAMLACRAEGVGCVLTTLLCAEEAAIKSLLKIPEEWYTCGVMPLGYPVGKGHGPISRRPVNELAFADTFGNGVVL